MQPQEEYLKTLEDKLLRLLKIHKELKEDKLNLEQENLNLKNKLKELREKQTNMEEEINQLKVAHAMNGSQEYKRLMKLKMNRLIKEVEHCILQIKNQEINEN